MKAKKGFRHALKATARKIAVLYYRVMTKGLAFVEHGIELYQQKFWQSHPFGKRTIRGGRLLQKKAAALGFQLVSV